MKKYILILFALVMTLFSLSCLEGLANELLKDSLSITTETSPSTNAASIKATIINGTGYTHTLYYVKASELDGGDGSQTDIQAYITAVAAATPVKEFETKTNPGGGTLQSPTPEDGTVGYIELRFELTSLDAETAYLFTIKSTHSTKDTIYTPVIVSTDSSNRGWFQTTS